MVARTPGGREVASSILVAPTKQNGQAFAWPFCFFTSLLGTNCFAKVRQLVGGRSVSDNLEFTQDYPNRRPAAEGAKRPEFLVAPTIAYINDFLASSTPVKWAFLPFWS